MFESIDRASWKDIAKDADDRTGKSFAKEFGPSGERRLVDSVEIGNEPGKWSNADYSLMFQSMAKGLRAGDPKLKIATCNLTTGKSGPYDKSVTCIEKFPGTLRCAEPCIPTRNWKAGRHGNGVTQRTRN